MRKPFLRCLVSRRELVIRCATLSTCPHKHRIFSGFIFQIPQFRVYVDQSPCQPQNGFLELHLMTSSLPISRNFDQFTQLEPRAKDPRRLSFLLFSINIPKILHQSRPKRSAYIHHRIFAQFANEFRSTMSQSRNPTFQNTSLRYGIDFLRLETARNLFTSAT